MVGLEVHPEATGWHEGSLWERRVRLTPEEVDEEDFNVPQAEA